jgi:hypothetical protein
VDTFRSETKSLEALDIDRDLLSIPFSEPPESPNITLRPTDEYSAHDDLGDAAGNPSDISMDGYLWHDPDTLHLRAAVTDDSHNAIHSGNMWRGDCIQLATAHSGTYGPEYGFAHGEAESTVWRWHPNREQTGPSAVELTTSRTGNTTNYQVSIPWETLFPEVPQEQATFPLSLLLNDNDGERRETFLMLTPPGLGYQKQSSALGLATLSRGETVMPWSALLTGGTKALEAGEGGTWSARIENHDNETHTFTVDIDLLNESRTIDISGQHAAEIQFTHTFETPGEKAITITIRNEDAGNTQTLEKTVLVVRSRT